MGGGVSPWLVAVLLVVCAVATASQVMNGGFRRGAAAGIDDPVELVVQEVARCANGQAVLVLREKGGERRLPLPIGAAEAAALDRRVHGEKAERPRVHDLAGQSISALGGRVTRAYIGTQTTDKVFLGHVTISSRSGSADLEARAADSVALALDAGAPILVARELLQRAGVDPGELQRGQNAQKARTSRNAPPAPVHRI
jgi:bifunctional DNase/RNase